MSWLPLVVAAVCTARAEEPGDPQGQLLAAIGAYAQGDIDGARARLQALLAAGPALPASVRQSALAYLGDVLFSEEGAEAARPMFAALLDEAPAFVMDPYEHPEPVCRYFDALRTERTAATAAAPTPVPFTRGPPPYWSLVPGGLHWYARDEVGLGVAVTLTQAGLLVGNVVLWQTLAARTGVPRDDAEALASYEAHRLATNITAGAFVASLLLPPAIEFSRWSAQQPTVAAVVSPAGIVVTGSF